MLPLDVEFTDEHGRAVRIGDYFGKRPVVLAFVYYGCPMLCLQSLSSLAATLGVLSENPGEDFEVVSVSIDPRETPALALEKKAHYVERSGKPSIARGLALSDRNRGEHPAPHEGGGLPLRVGRTRCSSSRIPPASSSRRRRARWRATCSASITARAICGWRCSTHPKGRSARRSRKRCSTATTTTWPPAATAWRLCASCGWPAPPRSSHSAR